MRRSHMSPFGSSVFFRKKIREKGLHRQCRFPEISRKKQGEKVMGNVIFREKKVKRVGVDLHLFSCGCGDVNAR